MDRKKRPGNYLRFSAVGISLVVATFIGLAIGIGLDRAIERLFGWESQPIFTLLFLLFGIAGGFLNIFREVQEVQRQEDEERKERSNNRD